MRAFSIAAVFLIFAACALSHAANPATRPAPDAKSNAPSHDAIDPIDDKSTVIACSTGGSMLGCFGQARQQIKQLVESIPAKARFDVIFFNKGRSDPASKTLATATNSAKDASRSLIDNAVAGGNSDPVTGFNAAAALSPKRIILILDQVPDAIAMARAVKTASLRSGVRLDVIFFKQTDDDEDNKAIDALDKMVAAGKGKVQVVDLTHR